MKVGKTKKGVDTRIKFMYGPFKIRVTPQLSEEELSPHGGVGEDLMGREVRGSTFILPSQIVRGKEMG
jgi:hypothetical protein